MSNNENWTDGQKDELRDSLQKHNLRIYSKYNKSEMNVKIYKKTFYFMQCEAESN